MKEVIEIGNIIVNEIFFRESLAKDAIKRNDESISIVNKKIIPAL